jgi:ABC-2 type transport system ATP-binding protein
VELARRRRIRIFRPGILMEQALIRIEGLVKSFPVPRSWAATLRHPLRGSRVEVLRGVSLEVRRGEFFGLLGPNGAGKTTLFKILATLIQPEAGRAEVQGIDVLRDPGAVRRVLTPVIADERSLNWRLTGVENLRLFAALYGVPGRDREGAALRLLDTIGLAEAAHRMVGTYSSGMKQRLLIARALLSRPAVLLLDEPTRSLDPVSARDFRRFLREEIAGRQGCTVMLATHDADEALELCDRLAVLHRGRLVAQGTARELAGIAGEHRYRVAVRASDTALALQILARHGLTTFAPLPVADEEGWVSLAGELPGGMHATAEVMRQLGAGGVSVGEFARIPLPLADLIERVLPQGEAA